MWKLQILVVILSTASLTSISGQVLSCNVDDSVPSFGEQKDVRVVDGYRRAVRTDPVFLGSNQSLTVWKLNESSFEDEYVGVCYSTSDLSCYKARNNEADCDNYMRGVAALEPCTPSCRVLVCGSNALLARCTVCNFTGSQLNCTFTENNPPQDPPFTPGDTYDSCSADNINGQGVFQFRKNHNATFLYVHEDETIYYGLVKENSNANSIIGLASLNNMTGVITNEVTTRTDSQKMVATEAHFVGKPFINGDFVYFLFREPAQEFASLTEGQSNEINTYYSRIARICKNDGGTDVSSARILTSFLKQRLVCCQKEDEVCSVEYNEIQDFVFSDDNMIHAIFTNGRNAAPMSALCVFDLAAIIETFNTGSFFGADGGTTNDLWREYTGITISPRPGLNCSNPNTGNTNFERDYNLMNDVQMSDVSVFMDGDRFSSLEMPEDVDVYIIASEWGCLYQVSVSDTNGTDLGDPCQDPIVSSPIKDLELVANNSYLVTSSDDVYILNECSVSNGIGGEEACLSPPGGTYNMSRNSPFEFIADTTCTGPASIKLADGTAITDSNEQAYRVLKNESMDTTDTLVLMRILILHENVIVEFPDAPDLNYMIQPNEGYTEGELLQRCDDWELANQAYLELNKTDTCQLATSSKPGNFSSEILLNYDQVQDCANCAYNDCADTCPPQ